jgi:hypothetical protein
LGGLRIGFSKDPLYAASSHLENETCDFCGVPGFGILEIYEKAGKLLSTKLIFEIYV